MEATSRCGAILPRKTLDFAVVFFKYRFYKQAKTGIGGWSTLPCHIETPFPTKFDCWEDLN